MNWTRIARCAGLAACLAAVPAAAQRINPDRVVDLHINLEAHNQSFGGSVREGTRFNLSINGQGEFALVPVVTNEARQQLSISVLRLQGDNARTVETVTATVGEPAILRTIGSTTVVVERLRMARRPTAMAGTASFTSNPAFAPRIGGSPFFGTCCVTCGVVKACGCAVSMECGSCCSDSCCVVETRGPGAPQPRERTFAQLVTNPCSRPIPASERRFTPAPGRATRLASSR